MSRLKTFARRPITQRLVLVAALSWGISGGARAQPPKPPDVDQLLARLDDLYRSTSSIARLEVQVINPRTTRSMRMKVWTRGEDEALIIIEAPAREEGTA